MNQSIENGLADFKLCSVWKFFKSKPTQVFPIENVLEKHELSLLSLSVIIAF